MKQTQSPTLRFDKVSQIYDHYATPQHNTGLQLRQYLPKEAATILECGVGTGLFTQQLQHRYPNAQITAIDSSPNMINYCQKQFTNPNTQFKLADIDQFNTSQKADLICSNASFQWSNDLQITLKNLLQSAAQNATLIFSTYGPQTFSELQHTLNISNPKKPQIPATSFLTHSEIQKNLAKLPLKNIQIDSQHFYFPFKTINQLLTHIKYTGAKHQHTPSFWTKKQFKQLEESFLEQYGCIFAHYEAYFVRATLAS